MSIACITSLADLPMWSVVALFEVRSSCWRMSDTSYCESRVSSFTSWKRSTRGFGMGWMKGWGLRIAGTLDVDDKVWGRGSPICGMVAMRALWSL